MNDGFLNDQADLLELIANKIDFIVAKDSDFDRSRTDRVRSLSIGENVKATFASPEDVILKKLQWFQKDNSDRHVRDILGMLHVQSSSIDHAYIDLWVDHLDVGEIWKWIKARLKVSNPTYE